MRRALLLLLLLAACAPAPEIPLPTPKPHQMVKGDRLRAGFGRADITPPPLLGLGGNGPEGRQARGWRTRLYARALILQDQYGERVALVTVDLAHVSLLLHRRVAELIPRELGISADNLLLSATHTHSGPGHFYEATEFNRNGSSIIGYDEKLTAFLANQVVAAIRQAATEPRIAKVAWGRRAVWGFTRNRSYEAFRRNTPKWDLEPPPPGLDPVYAAVNPIWTMLRVDLATDSLGSTFEPAGAYSVFAIHGTGNSSVNDLYDADIHGIVERGLESHINSLGRPGKSDSTHLRSAAHLFANGAEGDVSPDWPADSRCPLPDLEPVARPEGPGTPTAWDWRMPTGAAQDECVASARRFVRAVGDSLTGHAIKLFDSLEDSLSDYATIGIVFRTLALRDSAAELGICRDAAVGTSTAAGAEDARTRFAGWKFLGLLGIGLEEGGKAVSQDPKSCQGYKRTDLVKLSKKRGLPEYAQLMVLRIAGMNLIAVPFEPTTMAGASLQRAAGEGMVMLDWKRAREHTVVVSLANGFLQYLTTREEYSAQNYEGGSTLYGPGEAEMFGRELRRMANEFTRAPQYRLLKNEVDSVFGRPGKDARLWPSTGKREELPPANPRWIHCSRDTMIGQWIGPSPGQLDLGKPMVWVQGNRYGNDLMPLVFDDDPALEVRAVRKLKKGWLYQLRWEVDPLTTTARFAPWDNAILTSGVLPIFSDFCTITR